MTAAVPSTAQIEAALLNEGDGQQLIDAIVSAIGNTNLDEVALVAAIRADLERTGGRLSSISPLDRSRVNRGGDDDVRKTSALRKLATELISRAEDVSRLEAVIKLLR